MVWLRQRGPLVLGFFLACSLLEADTSSSGMDRVREWQAVRGTAFSSLQSGCGGAGWRTRGTSAAGAASMAACCISSAASARAGERIGAWGGRIHLLPSEWVQSSRSLWFAKDLVRGEGVLAAGEQRVGRRGRMRGREGAAGLVGKVRPEVLDAAAIDILTKVLRDNEPAETLIKKTFQNFGTKVTNEQRSKLSQRVLGVSALRVRLAYLVDYLDSVEMDNEVPEGTPFRKVQHFFAMAAKLINRDWSENAKDLLAMYMLHEEEKGPDGKAPAIPFLAEKRLELFNSIDPDGEVWEPMKEEDTTLKIAASCSLPYWLVDLWWDQICNPSRSHGGLPLSEVRKLAETCNKKAPVTLRVNRLKLGGRTALIQALNQEDIQAEFCKISPWGVQLKDGRPEKGIWNLAAWKAGLFEVQDEGSQLIALSTEAFPGEVIIDYCAGNGGKTLALAAMLQNQGQVWAHDVDTRRLAQIDGSLARTGCDRRRIKTINGTQLNANKELWYDEQTRKGGVDVVLVDAPCSSTGVLRRRPSHRWTLQEEELEGFPSLQKDILVNASRHVRPGGGLVYATCAINRKENEDVVDWFIDEFNSTFEPWPFENYGSNRRALLPHIHGTDGFFIARWRRVKPEGYDEKSIASVKRMSPDADDEEMEFLREVNKNAQIMATVDAELEDLEADLELIIKPLAAAKKGTSTLMRPDASIPSNQDDDEEEEYGDDEDMPIIDVIDVAGRAVATDFPEPESTIGRAYMETPGRSRSPSPQRSPSPNRGQSPNRGRSPSPKSPQDRGDEDDDKNKSNKKWEDL